MPKGASSMNENKWNFDLDIAFRILFMAGLLSDNGTFLLVMTEPPSFITAISESTKVKFYHKDLNFDNT